MPPDGRNPEKLKVLDFLSLSKWRRCLRRVQILKKWRSSIFKATCPGQLRCLGQNLFQKIYLFLRNHWSGAASLLGAVCFLKSRFFLNKQLFPGSFAALGRLFVSRKSDLFFEQVTCPGQCRCLGQHFFSKNGLSGILGLLCAEQNVANLKKWTLRKYGTPARRPKKSEKPN